MVEVEQQLETETVIKEWSGEWRLAFKIKIKLNVIHETKILAYSLELCLKAECDREACIWQLTFIHLGPYSQHSIFFVTYDSAQ
jgi:hypothetical protein